MHAPDLEDNEQEIEQESDNEASGDSQQTEGAEQAAVAPLRNRSATSPIIINK